MQDSAATGAASECSFQHSRACDSDASVLQSRPDSATCSNKHSKLQHGGILAADCALHPNNSCTLLKFMVHQHASYHLTTLAQEQPSKLYL